MNRMRSWVMVGLLLASQSAAAVQDVEGIACTAGELLLVTGPAFSALCSGDLRIDASSVIEADESITLLAGGSLWMAGTLVAPSIVLTAQAELNFTGGLFSGSPVLLPDVRARSLAGSPSGTLRLFSDLVPQPVVDPVYGAVTVTQVEGLPLVLITPIVDDEIVFISDEVVSPVPEPAHSILFALGTALVVWKRRAARHMS